MSRTNLRWTHLTICLGMLAVTLPVAQADVITAWTFENDTVAVNNNPAPSTGSGTASSIGMNIYATPNVGVTTDDVLSGTTGDTGVNGVADTSQIWRVRAQAGSNGAANGWSSSARAPPRAARRTPPTPWWRARPATSISCSGTGRRATARTRTGLPSTGIPECCNSGRTS